MSPSKSYILFPYQVSGHATMLCSLNRDEKIYKPLIKEEAEFYLRIKHEFPKLLPFLADYYGTCKINHANVLIDYDDDKTDSVDTNHEQASWALYCIKKENIFKRSDLYQYLVLKDLTAPFKYPVILELKLGSRQHSVNEPIEKVLRKIERCQKSTSFKLGVRVAGLMKHHILQGSPQLIYNKYDGRKLDENGFYQCIKLYFTQDHKLLKCIIKQFIDKLIQLKNLLQSDKKFEIYSSSILFIYEAEQINDNHRLIDLKMIDFARFAFVNDKNYQEYEGSGYMIGINSIIKTFQEILNE